MNRFLTTEAWMPHTSPSTASRPIRVRIAIFLVAAALILRACGGPVFAFEQPEEGRVNNGEIGRRIVEFVERSESAGFSGAVLAARKGAVVAAVGVGSADLDGKIPNTPASLFEIASATKQFTAAAVLRLVEQGRVGLDDSIAKHVPGVPKTAARSPCGNCCSTRPAFRVPTLRAGATTSRRCCLYSCAAGPSTRRERTGSTGTRATHSQARSQVLGEASKAKLFEPGMNNYALGWQGARSSRSKPTGRSRALRSIGLRQTGR